MQVDVASGHLGIQNAVISLSVRYAITIAFDTQSSLRVLRTNIANVVLQKNATMKANISKNKAKQQSLTHVYEL